MARTTRNNVGASTVPVHLPLHARCVNHCVGEIISWLQEGNIWISGLYAFEISM